jgi:hypothetical protein
MNVQNSDILIYNPHKPTDLIKNCKTCMCQCTRFSNCTVIISGHVLWKQWELLQHEEVLEVQCQREKLHAAGAHPERRRNLPSFS